MKIVECYPNSYDSADDCVATYQIDIDRAQDLPANCINAVASYFNCLGSLTCEEYASDAFYQCDEEFGGLIDEACSVPPA